MKITKRLLSVLLMVIMLFGMLPIDAYATDDPAITVQPESVTAQLNDTVKFSVTASGEGLTYQWQYRSPATATWKSTTLSGAKTATLKATATSARNGYQYRCVVTDADGMQVISNAVTLTVKTGPAITAQPESVTAKLNDTVTFSVTASGEGLTYQWQWRKNSTSAWATTTVSGNKTNTITVSATTTRNGYQYRCVVTDAAGVQTSSEVVTLTVKTGPSIVAQPQSVIAQLNDSIRFTVLASGEDLTYQWQWRKNSSSAWATTTVSGNKTNTITVSATTTRNGYQYRCVVTDADGIQTISAGATLTVRPPIVITSQPKNVTAQVGDWVSFTVVTTGGLTPYTYRWQCVSDGYTKWENCDTGWAPGAITDTLSFCVETIDFNEHYRYRCVITDANGFSVISDEVWVVENTSEA